MKSWSARGGVRHRRGSNRGYPVEEGRSWVSGLADAQRAKAGGTRLGRGKAASFRFGRAAGVLSKRMRRDTIRNRVSARVRIWASGPHAA